MRHLARHAARHRRAPRPRGKQGFAVGFKGLIDCINAKLPSNEVIERALRRTLQVYPEVAIRELLANAIVHQDLEVNGRVTVDLYEDRVEISNPGVVSHAISPRDSRADS